MKMRPLRPDPASARTPVTPVVPIARDVDVYGDNHGCPQCPHTGADPGAPPPPPPPPPPEPDPEPDTDQEEDGVDGPARGSGTQPGPDGRPAGSPPTVFADDGDDVSAFLPPGLAALDGDPLELAPFDAGHDAFALDLASPDLGGLDLDLDLPDFG